LKRKQKTIPKQFIGLAWLTGCVRACRQKQLEALKKRSEGQDVVAQARDQELDDARKAATDAQTRLTQEQERRQALAKEKADLESQLRAKARAAEAAEQAAKEAATTKAELATENQSLLAQLQARSEELELSSLKTAEQAQAQEV
jgi:hypothetical protein